MENLEQYWEQSFSPIGRKFTEIRPNYQDMGGNRQYGRRIILAGT